MTAFLVSTGTPRCFCTGFSQNHRTAQLGSAGLRSLSHLTSRRPFSTPRKRIRGNRLVTAAQLSHPGYRSSRITTSVKVAVLVSGGGRSLENVCEKITERSLTGCEVKLVVASKKTAGAIQRAQKFGIPTRVVRLKDYDSDSEAFSNAISLLLDEFEVDLVVMAGWMHFYQIPPRYEGKVINIHPSLIPAFCGKGYYGNRVHEAVLKFGAKITGCTVHLADNKYDHGPIILQKAVPVLDTDTADVLATRVFESEKEALPEAIQLFVDGRLSVQDGVVRLAAGHQASQQPV